MSNDLLAKRLVTDHPETVTISLYYMYDKLKSGATKLRVLADEDGKKRIEEWEKRTDKKKDEECPVSVLNTKWKDASWLEQNKIISNAQTLNPSTNQIEANWAKYRDLRVKTLMTDWDLEYEGQKLPVTAEFIDKLPAEIVLALFERFERATSLDSEVQGKQ